MIHLNARLLLNIVMKKVHQKAIVKSAFEKIAFEKKYKRLKQIQTAGSKFYLF